MSKFFEKVAFHSILKRARNRPIGIDDSTWTMSRNRNLSAIVLLEQYSAKNTVPVFLIWRD